MSKSLPRYATKFDFARHVQRDLLAGATVSDLARRYGVARHAIYMLAYGGKQVLPCRKLVEALGYDSKMPHYIKKNGAQR